MEKGIDKNYIFQSIEKTLPIKDIEFEYVGVVDFENKKHKYIIFENCIFNDRVLFTNVSDCLEFHFNNCQFNDVVSIESLKNINTVEFLDCNFNSSMSLGEIDDPEISIYFKRCKMKFGKLTEFHNLKMSSLFIQECDFSNFTIQNCEIEDLEIENSSVKFELDIINLKSELLIIKNELPDKLIKSVKVNSPEIKEFECDSITEIEKLQLFNFIKAEIFCSVKTILLYTGDFNMLSLGVTTLDDEKVNSRIDYFRIWNINQKGTVHINNVYINRLDFMDVDASSATYSLNETVLVDTSIIGCIFSKFYCNQLFFINNPEIIKSDVSSITINNLGWNNGKRLKEIKRY